jgi:hypothetical protein
MFMSMVDDGDDDGHKHDEVGIDIDDEIIEIDA